MAFPQVVQTLLRWALIACALALVSDSAAQTQAENTDRSNLPIRLITVRYVSAALIADLFGGYIVEIGNFMSGGNMGTRDNRGNVQGNRTQNRDNRSHRGGSGGYGGRRLGQ